MLAAIPRILFATPWGRAKEIVATVAVATVVVGGAALIPNVPVPGGGNPQPPGDANVWISTSGNDSNCQRNTSSLPCATFNRAYQIASCGDTVEIASGTYGNETMTAAAKSCAADTYVSFVPASGATVQKNGLRMDNQTSIYMADFRIEGTLFMHLAEKVYLDDMSVRIWFSRGSKDMMMVGGEVSGSQNGDSPTIGKYSGERESQNITFDGVAFHDIGRDNCPGCHIECLFIQEATNVTIKNGSFQRCAVMDIYVSGQGLGAGGSGNVTNLVIENNWFDTPTSNGTNALRMNPDTAVIVNPNIRNNSFAGGTISFDPAGTYTNGKLTGNIGYLAGGVCQPSGWTHSYNVWSSGDDTCGTGDTTSSDFGFVDQDGFDLHITSSSPAKNHGDPSNYPATDRDGELRPQGTVDAGADEIP